MPGRRIPTIERRPMLLEAARESFGEHGYQHTTLDDVARRAGVAKPVLYRHFGSKEQLYTQLILEQAERMQLAVRTALTAAPPEADRARVTLDATFAFIEREPFAWRVLVPEDGVDCSEAATLASRQAMVLLRSLGGGTLGRGDLEPASELDRLWAATSTSIQVQFARWWIDHPHVERATLVTRARAVLETVATTMYAGSATGG